MLVLSRKKGESLIIVSGDDKITVTITECDGHAAKIGVDAPKSVSIDREEIYHKKQCGK